jgi:hypothetical protein
VGKSIFLVFEDKLYEGTCSLWEVNQEKVVFSVPRPLFVSELCRTGPNTIVP